MPQVGGTIINIRIIIENIWKKLALIMILKES